MGKLNVAVLMGGKSAEHEISLMSGREVVRNLNPDKYNIFPVSIDRSGKNWLIGDRKQFLSLSPINNKNSMTSSQEKSSLINSSKQAILRDYKIDFVFIALHGPNGEDGTMQGFLDLVGVSYSGSGVLASSLSMHKVHSREVLQNNGFNVPKYMIFEKNDSLEKITKKFSFPLIVKPPNQGSSIGVSKVAKISQLKPALSTAFKYADTALIEEFIDGIEITGSVLGNDKPYALPLVEIVPKNDFFDFEAKYDESKCDEICPARINSTLTQKAQKLSVDVYKTLDCKGFGRIDMIIKGRKIYVLEANTIPGLSPLSLLPKAANAEGINYTQLLDKIITYSLPELGKIKQMRSTQVYSEINIWKKPIHYTKSRLAKIYLNLLPNLKVVGITGSVGKTLMQNSIYEVLSQKYNVNVGQENLDPTFRIPQSILQTKPWHDYLILEYGVEHPMDMDFYLMIVRPDIAVVANINITHTKYFKDRKGIYGEKVKLVKSLSKDAIAILNEDDPYVSKMQKETKASILWFGEHYKKGIQISNFKQNLNGSSFIIHYKKSKESVSWPVIGKHQLQAAYAAATVGISQGLSLSQIASGLSKVKPPGHRLNLVNANGKHIIDDTYNSSPIAAKESVNTLLNLGEGYDKLAVLGEMKDLGNLSKDAHEKLGQQIAKTNIQYLVTIGKVAKQINVSAKKNKFKGHLVNVSTTNEAINNINNLHLKTPLILIKGSRHEHMERIVYGLQNIDSQISCYHCPNLK